jgi:hypothetical protein
MHSNRQQRWRELAGCWLHERWRTELALRLGPLARPRFAWESLHNRHEEVRRRPAGAVECLWRGSSLLTVARLFPKVGGRLLDRCLHEWPVRFSTESLESGTPVLSVVLPVGGVDRLDLFSAVVHAFLGQSIRRIELVVVEHAAIPEYAAHCPSGAQYIHLPRGAAQHFNKSRALNAGVAAARARYVLLHDSDTVPPARYCETAVACLEEGYEGLLPIRLLFRLDREASAAFQQSTGSRLPASVSEVMQNFPGASQAISRDAFERVGGYDERYEGWGGEDEEFLERLMTRHFFRGSYAPTIHLWHPEAPKKASGDRNARLSAEILAQPAEERIRRLRSLAATAAHR